MSASRTAKIFAAAAAVPASLLLAGTTLAAASPPAARADTPNHATGHDAAARYRVRQILNGQRLRHTFIPAGGTSRRSEPLTSPDDIAALDHRIYTAFQNGVGPQGQASTDGNTDGTIVEFTATGRVVRQWEIRGKCDGLTADTRQHLVIATVNEDANSSIYTVTPRAAAGARIQHYHYSKPLPHKGGTDAISIYHGRVLISASAPGTTGSAAPQPAYPAVYRAAFDRSAHVVRISALFYDEARASVANVGAEHGKVVRLALIDPDSNEVVPRSDSRFAGDFMLTSQADEEQIFVQRSGRRGERLSVLRLSQSVDDTAWVRNPAGSLYGADTSGDTVDVVSGRFSARSIFVAVTPCDAGNAPATCPAAGFPPNYLGSLDPRTGRITRVPLRGPAFEPQGMAFISSGRS